MNNKNGTAVDRWLWNFIEEHFHVLVIAVLVIGSVVLRIKLAPEIGLSSDYELYIKGETGCMVYVDVNGNPKPLYLKDLQNEEGKIPPRRVDIEGGIARNYYEHICHYITPEDYEAAKAIVPNPEDYDFKKILNW